MRITRASRLIGIVATLLLAGTVAGGVALAATFKDVPNDHWAYDEIEWLVANGIARGFNDNTFRGEEFIKRQQAAFWFANYNNTAIEIAQSQNNPPAGNNFSHTTNCPAGKRAVAGGGTTNAGELLITDSSPSHAFTRNPAGWYVRWETDNNASLDPSLIRVWALCIPMTIP